MALLPNWTRGSVASGSTYTEYRTTGEDNFPSDAGEAIRQFHVQFDRRKEFMGDLVGYSTFFDGVIYRTLPDFHPQYPNMVAREVRSKPLGKQGLNLADGDSADFSLAEVTCVYKYVDYNILPDSFELDGVSVQTNEIWRYVTKRVEPSAEFLTTNGNFIFCTPGVGGINPVLKEPPGKLIPTLNLTYIWREVPANPNDYFICPNLTFVTLGLGKVNSDDFDGFAPGTVLFTAVEPKFIKPQINLGIPMWDIAMTFLVKNNGIGLSGPNPEDAFAGHNYLLNSYNTPAIFDLATSGTNAGTTSGDRIYGNYDLNSLFQVG